MATAPKPAKPAETWRPHSTPGFEVNDRGQLRTVNHRPGNVPPRPKLPIVIEDGDYADWEDCS